jgi:hypothetical protein
MRVKTVLLHGFLIWLVTFAVSFAIFPLRTSNRPLFESIMPVVLAACTVFFANRYHRKRPEAPAREWYGIGLVWLVMNWLLDAALFSGGPMKMTVTEYLADIGVTYLLIPVIAVGAGQLLRTSKSAVAG